MLINVSLVMSVFNEEESIEDFLIECDNLMKKNNLINLHEIIITNDGSSDNSLKILEALQERINVLRIKSLKHNFGAGYALNESIKLAKYDWTIILDSDGQFPAENIEIMTKFLSENVNDKCVIGIRNKDDNFFNVFGSKISGKICNLIYNSKLEDFNCALKLINTNILKSLKLEAKRMNYSTDLTSKLLEKKVMIKQLKIKHIKRKSGESSTKWFRTSFSRIIFIVYLLLRRLLIKFGIIFS